MKGRSHHRLPISEPPDDWGDGSWTVDCVCGVTFDDGEEMVNCDECGVWVHTRCSRFVRGEKSFACDKCKGKRGRSNNDNSEETEVAQLLIELPHKTVHVGPPTVSDPPRRRFRLWTDIPMEERVHVQGAPGGDPALFRNVSSVFTSQLWKCTGFVPKKFNFQYREYPCWEEEKTCEPNAAGPDEENENPADRGANVLFALSKDIFPCAPQMEIKDSLRGLVEVAGCEWKLSPKEKRQQGAKVGSGGGRMQNWAKKERNHLRSAGVHLGKRKKEDLWHLKDRSGRKKARNPDKEDVRKSGSTPVENAYASEYQEGDIKVTKSQDIGNENQTETIQLEPNLNCQLAESNDDYAMKSASSIRASADPLPGEMSGHNFVLDSQVKAEDSEQYDPAAIRISPKGSAVGFVSDRNHVANTPVEAEDGKTTSNGFNDVKDESQNLGNLSGGSSSIAVDSEAKPSDTYLSNLQDVQSTCTRQDSNGAISPISLQSIVKVEGEGTDVQDKGSLELPLSPVKHGKLNCGIHSPLHLGTSTVTTSENFQSNDMSGKSSSLGERKDAEGETECLSCGNKDTVMDRLVSTSSESNQCGQEEVDLLGHTAVQEASLKSRHGGKFCEESSKVGCVSPSPSAPNYRRLVVGVVGKSPPASSVVVLSKSSVSTSHKSVSTASPETVKTGYFSKQRLKLKSSTDWKKESPEAPKDEKNKQDGSQQPVKDHPKSPASGLKTSQTSRISFGTSKHSTSDGKELLASLPSKASLMPGTQISTGSVEHPVQSQAQGAPQGKHSVLASSQKSEKINTSNSYPSSKLFNSNSMNPPAPVNSSAALSDEELALLLHQELNSSPRVPRVPRVRHAGSMPQLASPSATSILAKRPPTSGGKDHVLVSRRKPKEETSKDTRNSREQADDSKKMSRLPSSPDNRRQDLNFTTDGPSKKDSQNRSPEAVASAKRAMQGASSTLLNAASSVEAIEQNLVAIRSPPKAMSDDDSSGVTRTLPGLIAEIMSKGKRMTYEALCNAVRPHWNNLRKHNGERYAYLTHSQAVLDCLRNRSEWARLIDRGPKTNSSRKRRKLDTDPIVESENEGTKDRPAKHVEGKNVKSQQEDVPKGKRKARKRRRLTLQGRGLKEVRKRQKAEAQDDDFGLYSSEGTESIVSEDESHGGRTATIGSDTSTSSSDENGI